MSWIEKAKALTPGFDPAGYLARYADLRKAYGNDLERVARHWISYGVKEKRDPTAYIPPSQIADAKAAQRELDRIAREQAALDLRERLKEAGRLRDQEREEQLKFTLTGGWEGKAKALTPNFDAVGYAARYPDLAKAFGNNDEKLAQHWLEHGIKEGRDPTAPPPPVAKWDWVWNELSDDNRERGVLKNSLTGEQKYTDWVPVGDKKSIRALAEPLAASLSNTSVSSQFNDWLATYKQQLADTEAAKQQAAEKKAAAEEAARQKAAAVAAPKPPVNYRSGIRNALTEADLDDLAESRFSRSAPAPTPAPAPAPTPAPAAPAPFNPVGFDWSKGMQNIDGTIYQPVFQESGSGETLEIGPLQHIMRYQLDNKPGDIYEFLDPTTGRVTSASKFTESKGFFGDLFSMVGDVAKDLAPLASFALGVGPLGGMLGGAAANALGISGLTAAQTAALGSTLGNAALGLVQGQDPSDILENALKSAAVSYTTPMIANVVGNAIPDQITGVQSVDDALAKAARDISTAAAKAAISGKELDVVNTLLPAVASGVSDATGIPTSVAQLGIQALLGNEITPEGVFKTIVQSAPAPAKSAAPAQQEPAAGYGGADIGEFFDSEEAQAVQDDIDSILARYPTPAPAPDQTYEITAPQPTPISELENILFQEANQMPESPAPDQRVEVTAPAPAPRPITELENILLQEANVMPEPEQSYQIKGPAPAPLFPEFDLPLATTSDEPRYFNVTEGQPQTVQIIGGGQSTGNALANLDLLTTQTPPGPLEGTTVTEPDLSQNLPTATAPAPASSRPPAPSAPPVAQAQSQAPNWNSLLALLNQGQTTPQYTTYNPVIAQLKDGYDPNAMFSVGQEKEPSFDDLLNIIGTSRRS